MIHPGVYRVGHDALVPFAPELAAVLFYRGHAVLSHRSGAAIWGIASKSAKLAELTVVGRDARGRPGVRTSGRRLSTLVTCAVATDRQSRPRPGR